MPYTNNVRKATYLVIISELLKREAKINAYDSHAMDEFKRVIGEEYIGSIEFVENRFHDIDGCDALILITEWKEFRNPYFLIILKTFLLF